MADIHLTREMLRGVLRGELPARLLVQTGLEHLMSLCPSCREEIESFQREQTAGAPADYSRTFEVLPVLLQGQVARLEEDQRQARRDLAELLRLPRGERAGRVKRARGRFRSPALVRLLLEESQKKVRREPGEAFHLAELARAVANANPQMPEFFDLVALATAHMANACRVGETPRQAEEHFLHARYVIQQHGVTHPEVLARVDDLEGSLRKDQGLFAKAEELFARAAMLYRLVHSQEDMVRALIKLGTVYDFQEDSRRAVETTRSALDLLPPDGDPALYLCGRFNLACQLFSSGRPEETEAVLEEDADLYRRFADSWTQLRLAWLRGDLAVARGETGPAHVELQMGSSGASDTHHRNAWVSSRRSVIDIPRSPPESPRSLLQATPHPGRSLAGEAAAFPSRARGAGRACCPAR
jgi:tetratricopeptide (TPR) repeat protein